MECIRKFFPFDLVVGRSNDLDGLCSLHLGAPQVYPHEGVHLVVVASKDESISKPIIERDPIFETSEEMLARLGLQVTDLAGFV